MCAQRIHHCVHVGVGHIRAHVGVCRYVCGHTCVHREYIIFTLSHSVTKSQRPCQKQFSVEWKMSWAEQRLEALIGWTGKVSEVNKRLLRIPPCPVPVPASLFGSLLVSCVFNSDFQDSHSQSSSLTGVLRNPAEPMLSSSWAPDLVGWRCVQMCVQTPGWLPPPKPLETPALVSSSGTWPSNSAVFQIRDADGSRLSVCFPFSSHWRKSGETDHFI